MRVEELISALPPCRVRGDRGVEITGISIDSRTVRQGHLFTALSGSRDDGHRYIAEARARGAAAILAARDVPDGGPVTLIICEDTRAALAAISDRFFKSPSKEIDVMGVTGTNGKTTVCYLLGEILGKKGRRTALIGTVEYRIGDRVIPAVRTTPEAPHLQAMIREAVDEGCDSLIMEVSSHALEQKRVACVEFDMAVFTNLGNEHLDFHHKMENYFAAKASLFCFPSLSRSVINIDDPWGARLAGESRIPVMTYGIDREAEVRGCGIELHRNGSRFEIEAHGRRVGVFINLLGRHNIYNALASASAALSSGMSLEEIVVGLAEARPAPGRLEEIASNLRYRIFVDYAHTAEALDSALRALRNGCEGRIILVFGCGGDRDPSKRRPMGRMASELADLSILTSDNPRSENPEDIIAQIARGFNGTGKRFLRIPDRRKAIEAALAEALEGDIVLVAGKGHERTQEFADTVVPFSDHDVIRELIGGSRIE